MAQSRTRSRSDDRRLSQVHSDLLGGLLRQRLANGASAGLSHLFASSLSAAETCVSLWQPRLSICSFRWSVAGCARWIPVQIHMGWVREKPGERRLVERRWQGRCPCPGKERKDRNLVLFLFLFYHLSLRRFFLACYWWVCESEKLSSRCPQQGDFLISSP